MAPSASRASRVMRSDTCFLRMVFGGGTPAHTPPAADRITRRPPPAARPRIRRVAPVGRLTAETSRAEFLSLGAKAGLALVAGGTILGAAPGRRSGRRTATSPSPARGDAELLAIDVYSRAIGTGFFTADVLAYMEAAKQNEQDHYDALAKVLGKDAPKGLTFTYPDGTFASAKSIATTGTALETAFVGAYMGAISALKDNGLKKVAAQIGANEAQHLTTLKSLGAGGTLVPNPSLPEVLTAEQATKAVTPFLAG